MRNVAGRGRAVQQPRHRIVVVAHGVMHGAAVVPHQDVADLPLVPVDVLRAGGPGGQQVEQRLAFLGRPALEAQRVVRIDVERLAPGADMRPNDRVFHRCRGDIDRTSFSAECSAVMPSSMARRPSDKPS